MARLPEILHNVNSVWVLKNDQNNDKYYILKNESAKSLILLLLTTLKVNENAHAGKPNFDLVFIR